MSRRPIVALVVTQVCLALALLVVALQVSTVSALRADVARLTAELQAAQQLMADAEADRVRLQDRVTALEGALLAAGVDPQTVPTAASQTPPASGVAPSPSTSNETGPSLAPGPTARPTATPTPAQPPTADPAPTPEPSPCTVTVPLTGLCLVP